MELSVSEITKMIDLSAVYADTDEAEVRGLADMASKYSCASVSTLPCHTSLLTSLLAGESEIRVGGVVGFPSGGPTTDMKVVEAGELVEMGCEEVDMVINVGLLRSKQYRRVLDDIKSVVEVARKAPVKVILECHYLSNAEIRKGCELCIKGGAAFVKTGTGWAPTGATPENIVLIKSFVGDAISIKAAGGIRRVETLIEMYRCGARRFGLGIRTAKQILEQLTSRCHEVM